MKTMQLEDEVIEDIVESLYTEVQLDLSDRSSEVEDVNWEDF